MLRGVGEKSDCSEDPGIKVPGNSYERRSKEKGEDKNLKLKLETSPLSFPSSFDLPSEVFKLSTIR